MNLDKLKEINDKATAISSSIKILANLSWDLNTEEEFLHNWEKGIVRLPKVEYPVLDYSHELNGLEKLINSFTGEHPLEIYTQKTIASYIQAIQLNNAIGTKRLEELSIEIYGRPGNKMPGTNETNIHAAQVLLSATKKFHHPYIKELELCIPAEQIKTYFDKKIEEQFKGLGPKVVIRENLQARATAGAKSVHLRSGTCYTQYDFDQLYVHEVMTHSLTSINGSHQKILSLLSRGSPRTTGTQEGLAAFSEVVSGHMDLNRIERMALRILAIEMALNGATFVDVFKYFLENSESPKEAYWSTTRIFRGGYPDKNIVFTKDVVYLDGLLKIYTLFKWALMNERLGLLNLLFCGRLTVEDLFLLENSYKEGLIDPPKFYPIWYERIEGLAGFLTFSLMSSMIDVSEIEEFYFKSAFTHP